MTTGPIPVLGQWPEPKIGNKANKVQGQARLCEKLSNCRKAKLLESSGAFLIMEAELLPDSSEHL